MLFSDLQAQRRPPRELPVLNTGSRWTPPAQLPSLKGVKRLGFDTETFDPDLEALGPGFRRNAHVVGFSLALDNDGPRIYVPVRHQGGGNLDEGLVKRWAAKELQEFDGELVGANISYDLKAMRSPQFGVRFKSVRRFRDVLIAEPILDEHRRQYNLDAVAKTHVGDGKVYDHVHRVMRKYGWKKEKDFKRNLWRLPAGDVGEYAEGDADLPMRVLDVQTRRMIEESREEGVDLLGVFDLECDLIPILVAMWERGVRVDVRRAKQIKRELEVERERHLAVIRDIAGAKAELMSPDSFAKALDGRGLRYPLTAKTQKPSITKEWLSANRGDALVDAIIGGRRVDYIINTFIKGHIYKHSVDGRVHPTFRQLKGSKETEEGGDSVSDDAVSGTIGRFSCENPQMQNIPARDPYLGPLIRSMFVPEEGEDWDSCDAAQIEYKYLTHFAVGRGAEEARQRYRDDPKTDFHVLCGELLGADANDAFVRKRIKNTNFCCVYGGGERKLALTFGCAVEEAREFKKKYDDELPFVGETAKMATKWALKRGFIVTILGRKARFHLWEKKSFSRDVEYVPPMPYEDAIIKWGKSNIRRAYGHKALNYKLQLSAADHMKRWIVSADREGCTAVLGPLLTTVHDEGNNSVPRTTEGREAAEHFRRCGETCIEGLRVPIQIKSKRGESWGACE